jgi:hypothetical protein
MSGPVPVFLRENPESISPRIVGNSGKTPVEKQLNLSSFQAAVSFFSKMSKKSSCAGERVS